MPYDPSQMNPVQGPPPAGPPAAAGGMGLSPAEDPAGMGGAGMDFPSLDPQAITQVIQAMMSGDREKVAQMAEAQVSQMIAGFEDQQRAAAMEAVAALQEALGRGAITLDDQAAGLAGMEPGERLEDPDEYA